MRTISFFFILVHTFFVGLFLFGHTDTFASEKCWFNFGQEKCGQTDVPFCKDGSCSLDSGVKETGKALKDSGINTDTGENALVNYVQTIILYFLGFVSLIAVIYIIYAGFQVMTGAGDEEKNKKGKNIIIYVIVGIVIMWLAYAIVSWIITVIARNGSASSTPRQQYSWRIIDEARAAYTESDTDTFREYQNQLRTAIQKLESELKVNKSVSVGNLQGIKNLVQGAYDRLPDFGEAGSNNETMKLAVDRDIDLAIKNPSSTSQVGTAISSISSFLTSAKIESVQGGINASPGEGNAPLTVSFEANGIKDPSGATPDQMNYIWWIRENGGVRRELGRGKSLVYTFTKEGSYTVFLDVISGSRNSKKKIDVLPLSTSKTIEVKPRLGEIVLLVNGVNVSNIQSMKINPTIGKMGIILDATASRATGGEITETKWDFGNTNSINYRGSPLVERQIFANEGDYPVKLTLITNNGQTFTKEIRLVVRDPAAVIQVEKNIGNIGDDMFFSSISYFTNIQNVEYSWQIQDDNNRKIISNIPGKSLKHKFDKIGNYIVTLTARSPNGEVDTDSKQITIESRAPIVNMDMPKAISNETPNIITFDASKSYDPDTMGKKGLTYTWRIDGAKVDLDNQTNEGSKGTLKFDTTGPRNVSLTVANAYGKVTTIERSFEVASILSANMIITPRVAPIGTIINFIAQSEHADFYEWNMGDGSPVKTGNKKIIQHIYQKTGVYDVTLTVSSAHGTETNQIHRRVFVTDTNSPFSMINISNTSNSVYYDEKACGGSGATVINRSDSTTFDGSKSINIDGSNSDLTYTWSYFGKVKTLPNISEKMSDIGCYPVKLTVRSNKNGSSHTTTEYVAIQNQAPTLTSLSTSIDTTKKDSQKVLVKVSANGASDTDGVVTSYIWYYTTESDKEPQSIQITQKPEITFVLPNITEKYYFGVILEDNDGAKTNSMNDGSEQVPLILDNQNGNIYMPLITLSMPKNAVLVGENVHISAEAKTIVGTNITKNAEYSWDFDGDGKFEERSNNPSVNYIFKTPGTYSMKLRVTYNGVSNTKFGTIYVKNPLKADAAGYELSNGDIYFLNTSEGIYSSAIWTINGEQTESPYSITIPYNTQPQGEDIGTLRIMSGDTDYSTYILKRSLLTKIGTGSDLQYQTSPRMNNDVVHLRGQTDKFYISLIGNNATTYKIDNDIRIDSDLDGIPDNDADNKSHASYTNGSAYSISDFGESRVRERSIRITLMSEGQVVNTKDIRIVLDFIPESTTTSGEDNLLSTSDSMSTFDRKKLEELAEMIRSSDSVDRVILMQQYNLMIENWNDSFSKAKSLIDIQETIDTTALSDDKKKSMSEVIDALLVGDATAIDEVTLASRLIEGLIPESSPNKTYITEKLNAITSHPGDMEENKKLGKEILERVKNDVTIEDKYKIHIKNQLLIIIHGGQTSVPSEEIQEASVSGVGFWGVIWGFMSGVVWIFLYIIGGIILVLILGYGFYLLSKKNSDIGFQDFLIDSVFHAKKHESGEGIQKDISTTPQPVIVNEDLTKKLNTDPLAHYSDNMSVQQEPIPATITPVADPLSAQSQASIPSWLQIPKTDDTIPVAQPPSDRVTDVTTESLEVNPDLTQTTPFPENTETQGLTTGIDPLQNIDEQNDPFSGEEEQESTSLETQDALPSWLQVETQDPISKVPQEDTSLPSTEGEINNTIESVSTEQTSTEASADTDTAGSDVLPDWLIDSLRTDTQTQPQEPINTNGQNQSGEEKQEKKKKKKTVTQEKVEENAHGNTPQESTNIPDWLK